jgi:hypothetical protein
MPTRSAPGSPDFKMDVYQCKTKTEGPHRQNRRTPFCLLPPSLNTSYFHMDSTWSTFHLSAPTIPSDIDTKRL